MPRFLLLVAVLAFAASATVPDRTDAAQKKGKNEPAKKVRQAGDKDGKDNVVGAIWNATAVNEETGEKKTFRFRAKDDVLYSNTGEVLGSIRPLKSGAEGSESEMKWNAKLPLQGSFKITMNKVGHWAGVLTTKDGKWKCRLDVVDR